MAQNFQLNPGETRFGIPTNLFATTTILVSNASPTPGRISMTAGGSPTEFDDILPSTGGQVVAVTNIQRNFGGVELAIKNEGTVGLAFTTE